MILSTTNAIEGRPVQNYLGIVCGEAIMGANVVRDIFASITDIVGGRSGAYESKLKDARDVAFREVESSGAGLGATALVGIDMEYVVVRDGMLMVTVSGTAVRI